LSLYIHVPWCVRKCPYCDFNSHARRGDLPEQAYLGALLEDLESDLSLADGRQIQTVFIGGGTPSLMSPAFYRALFTEIRKRLDLHPDVEITLEANPGTVETGRFQGFREAGINRLSVGVQSFDDAQLQPLGRIHDSRAATAAVQAAHRVGFDRVNIDLMYGLPQQTPVEAMADLQQALDLGVDHISWYQLTLEPNTEFYSRPPILPDDDLIGEVADTGQALLEGAGFQGYEISAWARPGQACRHNLNYWQFGDYLALGAGAHGKITDPRQQSVIRYWKTRQPEAYLGRIGSRTAGHQVIAPEDMPLEFMMNALRLAEGVTEATYPERTGLPLEDLAGILNTLRSEGWLTRDRLAPTAKGRRYLNALLEHFVE
jgi:putative oxygen-independent coproporphyrinogen III oxidase